MLRGKVAAFLPAYGGCEDVAAARAAGVLEVDVDRAERFAIMMHDGGMTEAEAIEALSCEFLLGIGIRRIMLSSCAQDRR